MSVDRPKSVQPSYFSFDWNIFHNGFFDNVFDFVSAHVQDKGAILLFHADDLKIKADLKEFMRAYSFTVFRKWMDIN
jgi:hypothetical protein